jgi:hypothetical protein
MVNASNPVVVRRESDQQRIAANKVTIVFILRQKVTDTLINIFQLPPKYVTRLIFISNVLFYQDLLHAWWRCSFWEQASSF